MRGSTRGCAVPEPLLEVRDLRVSFRTETGVVRAVDGLSLSVGVGEVVGIVGESGSGKTVSMMAVMRLIRDPNAIIEGQVLLRGRDLGQLSQREMRGVRGGEIAMIFQDPMTALTPVYTVGWQIEEQLRAHERLSKPASRKRTIELLAEVGIANPSRRVDDYPHEFSGGMRQRVMIAMALANDPDILIADEPTTALDVTIQAQIIELMEELQERTGAAIIMITHDLGVVADMADRILVMYAGRAVEYGTIDEVFYQPLHPYTWGLMDSLPSHNMTEKSELCPIKGQPPSLIHLPSGCSFHPRCPYAKERCTLETPPLRPVADGHLAACHFAGDNGFTRAEMACAGVSA
jgi:oligopeptide transport system ATP-binding protein